MPSVSPKNGSDSELSPEQERAHALALLDAGCHTKYVAKYLNLSAGFASGDRDATSDRDLPINPTLYGRQK